MDKLLAIQFKIYRKYKNDENRRIIRIITLFQSKKQSYLSAKADIAGKSLSPPKRLTKQK